MPTPADILSAIDLAVLQLVQDGAHEVEVMGQRYRNEDLDKLRLIRREYQILTERDALRGSHRAPVIQAFR